MLDVTSLGGPLFPGIEDLLDALTKDSMPACDIGATPPENEIELNHFALQIGPIMLEEHRDLRRKANAVTVNCLAQPVDAEILNSVYRLWYRHFDLRGRPRDSVGQKL